MKPRKILIPILILCGLAAILGLLLYDSQSIHIKQMKSSDKTDTVFVGSAALQENFEKSLRSAEASAKPFREAGDLVEAGKYDEAINKLNESLQKSTRKIEKLMVYDRLQEIYKKQGDLSNELKAIEAWFANASDRANNPKFAQRAEEIRQLLKNKQASGL